MDQATQPREIGAMTLEAIVHCLSELKEDLDEWRESNVAPTPEWVLIAGTSDCLSMLVDALREGRYPVNHPEYVHGLAEGRG